MEDGEGVSKPPNWFVRPCVYLPYQNDALDGPSHPAGCLTWAASLQLGARAGSRREQQLLTGQEEFYQGPRSEALVLGT
ncbi:hypothetical protein RRG08_048072 [Elysia crispata]|uniref:Uncharacterized protein n=1 Tax=Elysia crispata TaxID=231223 RepID=A0AAE0Z2I1_9GAST|nr:hypothetical protein RRG08_048072 [Elysia crispata]